MKANLKNIQFIYQSIPTRYEKDGIITDGYDKLTENHFADGWRNVIIESLGPNQKHAQNYILENDIVVKKAVDMTEEEIIAKKKSQVPEKVYNLQLRLALIDVGIMPSFVTSKLQEIEDEVDRERKIALFEFANFIERKNQDLISMAKTTFGMTDEQIDNLFILANTK